MSARAVLAAGALSTLVAGAAVALPAGAAPGGGGCQLHGNVKFTHGPNGTDHPFTYTFSGALSNCQSNESSPASGSISTLIPGKGSGTCANGTTSGVAIVAWADKTKTIISYTTNSAAAEVVLQGTVVGSYKVGRKTYKTTRFHAGDGAVSDLAFEADPQQCAGSGVTSAPMDGFAGIGHQS